MPSPNEKILNGQILHAVGLERYKEGTLRRMLAILNKGEADLVSQIARRMALIDERGYDLGPTTTKRLKALIQGIAEQRRTIYREFDRRLTDDLFALSGAEVDFQINLLDDAAGVTLDLARPSEAMLQSVVTAQPFQGRLLKEWAEGLAENDIARVSDAVRIGMVEGQTTDQIIRRIRGTRALQYRDGILEISRRDAASVTRTAVNHTANRAREEMWAANADILDGVQWVSTLDSRTSPVCRARDGEVYPVNSGPRPPAHFNCRSTTVAYFGPAVGETRASADGPVRNMNYSDWLRQQPVNVQEDILGVHKARLFREGDLPLDRFTNAAGKEYSLEQLRQRDAEAFDMAFGSQPARTKAQRQREEKDFKGWVGTARYNRLTREARDAIDINSATRRNLSEAELTAVHAYTRAHEYHYRLNEALRSGKAERFADVAPMANVLDNALAKLPVHSGTVMRITDLPFEVAQSVRRGDDFIDDAFMSASLKNPDDFEGNFEFRIISRSGREITGFSAFPDETEILFPRGTRFAILRVIPEEESETGRVIVYMKER